MARSRQHHGPVSRWPRAAGIQLLQALKPLICLKGAVLKDGKQGKAPKSLLIFGIGLKPLKGPKPDLLLVLEVAIELMLGANRGKHRIQPRRTLGESSRQ